ncbi:hypothetical protein EYF80_015472 [Liparis tanakae]|uniref:Uncharacterized protein n=1 Tax=Liparis tanakae TaxID=230148 RepID=A0A4Z2I842_9TELE|nr:hypothetical protein EYF80_015472 [Liparis tanakae]
MNSMVGGQGRGQAGVGPGCPLINSCSASHAGLDGWEGDSSWDGEKVKSSGPEAGTPGWESRSGPRGRSLQAGIWKKGSELGAAVKARREGVLGRQSGQQAMDGAARDGRRGFGPPPDAEQGTGARKKQ